MLRKTTAIFALLAAFALLYVLTDMTTAADKTAMEKALKDSITNGAKLYVDVSLGTTGKTCNTCHMEMGKSRKKGMMGAMGFVGRHPFPKFFPMAGRVMTLEQVVQFCIVTPLKGKPFAWDDQRLTDLTAYVNSIHTSKR